MKTTIYVHASKDSNYDIGMSLGLKEDALNMFLFACCEVALGVEVDKKTGIATIISVDGKKLIKERTSNE